MTLQGCPRGISCCPWGIHLLLPLWGFFCLMARSSGKGHSCAAAKRAAQRRKRGRCRRRCGCHCPRLWIRYACDGINMSSAHRAAQRAGLRQHFPACFAPACRFRARNAGADTTAGGYCAMRRHRKCHLEAQRAGHRQHAHRRASFGRPPRRHQTNRRGWWPCSTIRMLRCRRRKRANDSALACLHRRGSLGDRHAGAQ